MHPPPATPAAPVGAPAPRPWWWRAARAFFLPDLRRRWFWARLAAVALGAWLFFRFLCFPMWVSGHSMAPTYRDRQLVFCWRLAYAWREPRPGAVVMLRFRRPHLLLFKRVVAVAGETVEFRGGRLYVDGQPRPEPYVLHQGDWEGAPVTVRPGFLFVVGDNRGMPMRAHRFGEVPAESVIGGPLW